jgi:hypothetical protein
MYVNTPKMKTRKRITRTYLDFLRQRDDVLLVQVTDNSFDIGLAHRRVCNVIRLCRSDRSPIGFEIDGILCGLLLQTEEETTFDFRLGDESFECCCISIADGADEGSWVFDEL